ncbi:glycosyltransferase family 2 protein [Candidatus Sororendozoicomonas aggregata]|uniref:glycosyltransferase family 2 protein n=1 Tax=Candidatus Sororendozoicomonas aggregata TaxID=3073239 RepID=UPI002ED62618
MSECILLTVIVPVYNAEKYIRECLESLIEQVVHGVEVVVVDDGSPDDSMFIINNDYKREIDSGQLILLSQSNKGVSSARNYGLSVAKGAYITFVDSDDKVNSHYVASILSVIESGSPDIIEFGFNRFSDDYVGKMITTHNKEEYNNIDDVIGSVFASSLWFSWSRCYKKTLLEGVSFPEGVAFCEDLMVIPPLYQKAHSVYSIRESLYGYRVNRDSVTRNLSDDHYQRLENFLTRIASNQSKYSTLLKCGIIYSLHRASGHPWGKLSEASDHCRKKIRKELFIYRQLNWRRSMVVIYPPAYKLIQTISQFVKSKISI